MAIPALPHEVAHYFSCAAHGHKNKSGGFAEKVKKYLDNDISLCIIHN